MRRLAVVGAFAAFAVACTIVNGLELGTGANDGGVDPTDAEAGIADPCNHAYPPERPSVPPVSGGVTFVSALRSIDLGTLPDGGTATIGYDLDRTCSCITAPGSCLSPVSNPNQDASSCDQPGGVDNVSTELFQKALLANIDLADDLRSALASGSQGILIWVNDYNGQDDDPSVDVAIVISPGLEGGGRPDFDASDQVFDVNDQQGVVINGGVTFPKAESILRGGYVRSKKLVVQGAIRLPLLTGLQVDLAQGYLVGDIEKNELGNFYVARGTVTGRAPLEQVVRAIGGIEKPKPSEFHLCDDHEDNAAYFDLLKRVVCEARDVMHDPKLDNTGAACDSLSLGVTFLAVGAKFGTPQPLQAVTYCADASLACP